MTKKAFQRARQPEQKRQRRAAILAAAEQLLELEGFDAVSLNQIARRVGLAKSNVYRYVESREQIFLILLLEDMRAWSDEVERQIAPLAGHNSPAAVAKVLAAAFTGRTRLCELNSVLASVLERNVSDDVIADFKTQTNTLAVRVGESLRAALGGIPAERAVWLQRCMFALAAGMWPSAHASATVERELERPRSHALRPSFGDDLEDSVRALLYGLLVEGWRASGRPVARS